MSLDLVPKIFGFCVFCAEPPLILRCKNINSYFNIFNIDLFLTILIVFELMDVRFRSDL